jgi:hypothetical protein
MRKNRKSIRIKTFPELTQFIRGQEYQDTIFPESQISIPGVGRLRTGTYHQSSHDTNVPKRPKPELINQK